MMIKLTDRQKKKVLGFKILKDDDYSVLLDGTNMYFYNLLNNQLSFGRFKKIHSEKFIICNNKNGDQRVFDTNKFIIFYKPKISSERLFMENLYNNLKVIKEQ